MTKPHKKPEVKAEKSKGGELHLGYVHIDEFLTKKKDLSPHDKAGFRIFMKGRTYLHSMEDFEKELKAFFNRKR